MLLVSTTCRCQPVQGQTYG